MKETPTNYLWFTLAVVMLFLGIGVIALGMITMPPELSARLRIATIGGLAIPIGGVFMAIHVHRASGGDDAETTS